MSEKRKKITKEDRKEIYAICGGRCAYCGAEIQEKEMQVDHVIPLELKEVYGIVGVDIDSKDNFLPACRSCNHYKSTFTLEKFRKYVETITDRLKRDNVTYKNAVRFGMVKEIHKEYVFYFEKIGVVVKSIKESEV